VTPSLPLVGQDFAGYRLRAVLGRGGMSVVYEAENVRLGNTIALKVLSPELSSDDKFRARFLRESRIAASLNHPNVIPIYDTGPCEELLYIAMRYVAGSDLRTVLDKQGSIPPANALLLIGQAGRALDAAHRLGLVHRDVKPANVLIEPGADDEPDHVYLADFGITKHKLSNTGLTATGQLVGTIDYIAPEQIQGRSVDGRADIYSLGCVLYECITGQPPFVKDVDAAVIWAHVEELPKPPSTLRPELPVGIDAVITRALAKDPNDRYQTCREFVVAATAALEETPRPTGLPASGVDIAAGPPTVLSGTSTPQPEPTRPPTAVPPPTATPPPTAVPPPTAAPVPVAPPGGGSQVGTPAPQEAGTRLSPETTPSDPEPLVAAFAASPPPAREQSPPPAREQPPAPPAKPGPGGPAARPSRRPWYALLLLVLVGGAAAALILASSSSSPKAAGELSASALAQVPTNRVTGTGAASVRLNGNAATVTVTTNGLDDNDALVHAMHIHAGAKGECPPASAARLHNGHLTISTTDGINYYGPPVVALTTKGETSPSSILAFPRYLTGGTLHYERTIVLPPSVAADIRKDNAVVVVHGIDYDNTGIYSGVLERSELDKSVPATATAPALCGKLVGQVKTAALSPRSHRRERVYTASLVTSSVSASELFMCEVGEATDAAGESRRRSST
jgi:serine/threonine protein kinase